MTSKSMYRACSRCGKIHAHGHKCYANSRNYDKHSAEIRKFRNSQAWKNKSEEIRERDKYLCQVCLKKNILNYKDLSVHHITSLKEDFSKRLDNDNLITLCELCHRKAEVGKIPSTELQAIVNEIMKDY